MTINHNYQEMFFIEVNKLLQEMELHLLQLSITPIDEDTINNLFRAVHAIRGASRMIGFNCVSEFASKIESVIEKIRCNKLSIEDKLLNLLSDSRKHLSNLVRQGYTKGIDTTDLSMQEAEQSLLKRLNETQT